MERKGGCCLAPRYGGGGAGAQASAAWQMGRIMLKFRPIAPKPAAMAPVPSAAPAPVAGAGRGKRKAAGGGGGRRGRKPKKAVTVASVTAAPATAAAPEVGERKESEEEKSLSWRSSSSGTTSVDSSLPPPPQPATLPLLLVSSVEDKLAATAAAAAAAVAHTHAVGAQEPVAPRALRPVAAAACVTVEDVTTTWRDGEAPSAACIGGDGDDAAPAFVSDQWDRVTWTNAAFGRAVSASAADSDDAPAASDVRVGLVGALPAWGTCVGFTCRVRVRHARGSVVAPCDVWRLDAAGCYLWRLDLQAALTLGGLP